MKNIIVLYNPYYQRGVIEEHVAVLKERGVVAFGKVRSKIKNMLSPEASALEEIYASASEENYFQLFLSDYADLYVAKVTRVSEADESALAPSYYRQKNLEVEKWFVIADIRELVRDDFAAIRDRYLAGFAIPSHGGHTYAIYGNDYVYPLIADMKREEDYFERELPYYPDIYKSAEFLAVKDALVRFNFGSRYGGELHPDSMENLVSAELEYWANRANAGYDFSSVVVKYSKVAEKEIHRLFRALVDYLAPQNPRLKEISYEVQGKAMKLGQIHEKKPNLGTYKALLWREKDLKNAVSTHLSAGVSAYLLKTLPEQIGTLQDVRNEGVHGRPASLAQTSQIRSLMLGLGGAVGMTVNLVKSRAIIEKKLK